MIIVNIAKEQSKSHLSQLVHSAPDQDWKTRFQTWATTRKAVTQSFLHNILLMS